MTRDLTAGMVAESDNAVVRPVYFLYLDVVGDPLWAWTGMADISITVADDPLLSSGRTFTAVGHLGSVSDVVQDASGRLQRVVAKLLAADFGVEKFFDFVNNEADWSLRSAVLWFGFVNEAGLPIADPFRLLTGRMDKPTARGGTDSSIAMEMISHHHDGRRANGLRLTDAHQQQIYPGDLAFEFVEQLAGKELVMGEKVAATRVPIGDYPRGRHGVWPRLL